MIAQTEEEDSELDINRNTLISPVGPPLTNIQETGIKNQAKILYQQKFTNLKN